jgi:hypothetical protein
MFTQRRYVVTVAAVLATVTTGGGLFAAVELAARPAHPQPTIVQSAPATAPAVPAFEDIAAGEQS